MRTVGAAEAIVRSAHKSSDDSGCGHDPTERLAPHKICEYLACSPGMNVLVVECSGGNSRPSCPSGVGGGTLGKPEDLLIRPPITPRPAQASFGHAFDQFVNSYRAAMALPTSAPSRSGCRLCSTCAVSLNVRMRPRVLVGAHPAEKAPPKIRLICRHFGSIERLCRSRCRNALVG
jgi:hypothetical protein